MDLGQAVFILSRLILGALASFFAILFWSRTRDLAWIFVIISAIAAYVETIFSILKLFGIISENFTIGTSSILLSSVPTIFLIAAFLVMLSRKNRRL